MSALFILGLLFILIFGFSVSAYVTCYKCTFENLVAKVAVFLLIGAVVSMATFTVSIALVWPPIM